MKFTLFSLLALLLVSPALAADQWRLCSRVIGEQEKSMLMYKMTLNLEGDRVFGNGGCNQYSGKVVRNEKYLFQDLMITQMACNDENGNYDEDLMNAEARFMGDLSLSTAMSESEIVLKIETANRVELRFAPEGQCRE